jgi:chemotaxis protein histidine kinase CheA
MVETCLDAIIGEDRAAWEFNSVHLPAEIHLRDRMVQLYWHPIPNRMGMTEYVMLVLRDVTEQRNYEALLQNERHERDLRNVKTLELRQANFLQVERFLQRVAQSNQARIPALPPATELLRVLHTWKGEARTLGLKSLAAEIHGLEDVWSQGAVGNAKERLETLQVMVKDYLSLLDDPLLHAHGVRKISLSSVCQDLFHEAQTRLLTEGIAWGEIKMVDAIPTWTEARADLVRAILLHAISNSIDHGFIRAPAEFRARVKVELETEVRIMDTELVINLYDNGQGIQWDRIQELAASRGVVAQTRDELQHVLFSDGFSSADQMSLSSGRGVGLAAIQGICEEQGGRASLRDRPEQNGAHLEVRLPVNPGAESIVSAAS